MHRFSESVTYMIILDMLIVPFTGVEKDDNTILLEERAEAKKDKKSNSKVGKADGKLKRTLSGAIRKPKRLPEQKSGSTGIDDPVLERDFIVLLKNYLKGDAIIDISANIPGLVYTFTLGSR